MKKLFVLSISIFLLFILYAGKPVTKYKIQYSCSYTRTTDLTEENFWLTKLCDSTNRNIVKSAESAVMLAYVYVLNLYGEGVARGEQPYRVNLVNDSIWCISGNPQKYKNKKWKGSFIIAIDKNTGRLLAYMHEK